MRYLILFILLSFSTHFHSYGQTIVNTDISSNTVWDLAGSPYQVTNGININTGVSLTVDPGVEVRCNPGVSISVNGTLSAIGTATDSIRFSSANQSLTGDFSFIADWSGLRLQGNGSIHLGYVKGMLAQEFLQISSATPSSLIVEHCLFLENEYTMRGLDGSLFSTAPTLNHCTFKRNHAAFIVASLFGTALSNVSITDCAFENVWRFVGSYDPNGGWTYVYAGLAVDIMLQNCSFIDVSGYFSMDGGEITSCHFAHVNLMPDIFESFVVFLENYSSPPTPVIIQGNTFETYGGISIGQYNPNLSIHNNTFCVQDIPILASGASSYPATLDLSNNCWCTIDSLSIISQVKQDSFSISPAPNIQLYPIDSSCVPTSVYPGDANHDQIANNVDLLPIGLHFGMTGPTRPNASLAWTPQPADGWGDSLLSTGVDIKHVDTDGNGIINDDDTLAVNLNYLLTHNGYKTSSGTVDGIPLYLEMPATAPNPGDTLALPVMFGTVDTQAVDVYGLAFTIGYDTALIAEIEQVNYAGSWLGTKGTDMLTLTKGFDSLGRIDMALVRTDHVNETGYGQIAEIIIVVDDDIFKKEEDLVFSISDVYGIDASEAILDIDAQLSASIIEEPDTTSSDTASTDTIISSVSIALSRSLQIYPNPASEEVLVQMEGHQMEAVAILDPMGQIIERYKPTRSSWRLDISDYPRGLYLVQVKTRVGIAMRKLMVH